MKISQLIVAAGLAAASLVGFGGNVVAAPAASTSAVACVNGDVVAPVQPSGNDGVSALTACDVPACADGVLATVTDDSGVQHQACVASAVADPAAPTPARAAAESTLLSRPVPPTPQATPQATSLDTGQAQLPRTGAGTGGLVIAALLVGCGSIASLLSRRKADRR